MTIDTFMPSLPGGTNIVSALASSYRLQCRNDALSGLTTARILANLQRVMLVAINWSTLFAPPFLPARKTDPHKLGLQT